MSNDTPTLKDKIAEIEFLLYSCDSGVEVKFIRNSKRSEHYSVKTVNGHKFVIIVPKKYFK